MLLIYIYYMRDQLLRIFLNIETVCIHFYFLHIFNNIFRLFVHIVMQKVMY